MIEEPTDTLTLIENYNSDPAALISILNDIQDVHGWLPREELDTVSAKLNLPLSKIYGVITFYSQYNLNHPGKHSLRVCTGTACFVKNAGMILTTLDHEYELHPGETTDDGMFDLEKVACLGCCALAPVVEIDGEVHGEMKPSKIKNTLKRIMRGEEET